jgi:hypothetical protein
VVKGGAVPSRPVPSRPVPREGGGQAQMRGFGAAVHRVLLFASDECDAHVSLECPMLPSDSCLYACADVRAVSMQFSIRPTAPLDLDERQQRRGLMLRIGLHSTKGWWRTRRSCDAATFTGSTRQQQQQVGCVLPSQLLRRTSTVGEFRADEDDKAGRE